MPILHLGVIDLAYIEPQPSGPQRKAPKRPPKRPRAKIAKRWRAKYVNLTTGDVAEILEAKYHIFENFYRIHENDVAADVEKSLQGAVESFLMGAPLTLDPFGTATSSIENRMKKFISDAEMEKIGYPGVPTQAALEGFNPRFKNPRTGVRRPSFIATGLFMASMTAWIS